MSYQCRREEASFLENAPEIIINVVEVPASADAIFRVFEDAHAWTQWFKGINKVEWTSDKPYGPGTTRTVHVGPLVAWEHFFRWTHNEGFSFYFEKTNLPLFKALVEDYQLERIDDQLTRFTYTVAYEPNLLLRLSGAIGRRALRKNFGRAAKSLVKYMQSNRS